jgi:peptide chain release factor 2
MENEMGMLSKEMSDPSFWNDQLSAQKKTKRFNDLKSWADEWKKLSSAAEDLEELAAITGEEERAELESEFERVEGELDGLEMRLMLGGEDDARSAILSIHPGAGGTESCDWAQMLFRMYTRWIERKGFESQVLDYLAAEEAGLKDATIEVKGEFAYGKLRSERGIHRLVRLSPFDAAHRRHTSFASVFVYPEIESSVEIEIRDGELKLDTFRSSGPGGQNVNKVNTAVRITHVPTGLVVTCQTERSQFQNRQNAMKILMSKLYQMKKEEEEKRLSRMVEEKTEIGWGNQIRSYVMHPYRMVKDHRTDYEVGDVDRVMDGDIDGFIRAYLLKTGLAESARPADEQES